MKMFSFKREMLELCVILFWCKTYLCFDNVLLRYLWTSSSVLAVLVTILTYDYNYWRLRGIFSPPTLPLVGNISSIVRMKEQGGICFQKLYDKYKDKYKYFGIHQFYTRTLVVCDPELIKRICVADFNYFVDRGFFFDRKVDPLAESVLFLRGNEWRRLRAKISPIFSPNKLKGMLPFIDNTASEFVERIKKRTIEQSNTSKIDVFGEKLFGGYTADAIVPCAFGLKSNVMENEKDPFAMALQAFYEMSFSNIFEKTMRQFWPGFALFFKMRIIPKKTHDFFYNIVTSVLRAREKGEQAKRGDFIDMMMSLRNTDENNNSSEDGDVLITDMIISANAFIIFLGGFETTSSSLAFLFLELASNQEVQKKMRKEIFEVLEKHNGTMSYEALQELNYMDMVIQETLRLYPPFPYIQRLCTKEYELPDTKQRIEVGTLMLFPTLGIQRDEKYFESALQFIPERWQGPQPPAGVFMPFGDGPRYCIGKRFASIQMKCCLARVLHSVQVLPVSDQPRVEPFAADPRSPLTLHPQDSKIRLVML